MISIMDKKDKNSRSFLSMPLILKYSRKLVIRLNKELIRGQYLAFSEFRKFLIFYCQRCFLVIVIAFIYLLYITGNNIQIEFKQATHKN